MIPFSSLDKKIQNIHLIVAMQAEAFPIIKKMNLEKVEGHPYYNIDIYRGKVGKNFVHLFVNQKDDGMDKIGTVHGALLTYKAIQFLKPTLILSIGTAGGIHSKSIEVFDIIAAKQFVIYHDRFSGEDEKSLKQSFGFLPVIPARSIFSAGHFKEGVIASSNSLLLNSKNWENIHKYKVVALDMEAAGVAEVAYEFSIPFTALKVVTDYVYEVNPLDTLSQFVENFQKATNLLSEFLFENLTIF